MIGLSDWSLGDNLWHFLLVKKAVFICLFLITWWVYNVLGWCALYLPCLILPFTLPLMPSVKCTFPDFYQQLLKCSYKTHAFQGTCESTTAKDQNTELLLGGKIWASLTNPRILKSERKLLWSRLSLVGPEGST